MSTTAADALAPLIRAMVNDEIPVKIAFWDGSRAGRSAAPWQLNISKRGLRRLLWAPNEVGLARAYVSGDIDVDGDMLACLEELERVSDPSTGPRTAADAHTKAAFAKAALRLGVIGLPPKPPREEAKPYRAHRHDKRRDAKCAMSNRCANTMRGRCGPGCPTWRRTGTRRCRAVAPAEHGYGGCTWRGRRWGLPRTGSA